jgi:hypothetical protein
MNFSPKKFLSAAAIAVAMTVGLAAPASATTYTLTADDLSISNGEFSTITTDAPSGTGAYFFVNGVLQNGGGLASGMPFAWNTISPCATVDVTLRVYAPLPGGLAMAPPSFSDAYAGSVTIEFIGDNFAGCNPAWGTGDSGGSGGSGGSGDSGETLAKTGSDASTAASLTGVAGAAALVVAAAVALRLRRANR